MVDDTKSESKKTEMFTTTIGSGGGHSGTPGVHLYFTITVSGVSGPSPSRQRRYQRPTGSRHGAISFSYFLLSNHDIRGGWKLKATSALTRPRQWQQAFASGMYFSLG